MEDIDTAWDNFCDGSSSATNNGGLSNNHAKNSKESAAGAGAACAGAAASTSPKVRVIEFNNNELPHKTNENSDTIKYSVPRVPHILPKCSPLNISTKTKISYLNYPIDLKSVFWKIPLVTYYKPTTGVIKKQMKFNSTTQAEVDEIIAHRNAYDYFDEYIMNQINNPDGRIKFKDIRKLSFGICRKDINSYRCKKKSAFYNCFVVILRLLHNDKFKEIHIKVFNTGKLEIPGIQDAFILNKALDLLIEILTPLVTTTPVPLKYLEEKTETVMINSNFNCGYYINREKLTKIISHKYKINSNYDPCSYPGIQCEFYNDPLIAQQHGMFPSSDRNKLSSALDALPENAISKVSFMIFRTGSVLIVGKCSEETLYKIYDFLCELFKIEFKEIRIENTAAAGAAAGGAGAAGAGAAAADGTSTILPHKERIRKIRKKIIIV